MAKKYRSWVKIGNSRLMGTSSKASKGLFNIVECTTVCLRVIHEQIIVFFFCKLNLRGIELTKHDDFWVKISSSHLTGTRSKAYKWIITFSKSTTAFLRVINEQRTKGSHQNKKCPKKWKKSKRGGRGQRKKSKSPKFKIWTFW